jgi:hypothetical protein
MAVPVSYPYPYPNTPFHTNEDFSRLWSLTEESIFLQDGVFLAQDLVPKSHDGIFSFTDASPSIAQMEELLTIGNIDTQDLGRRIHCLSTAQVMEIARHHRYQFQVMKAMWKHQREKTVEMQSGQMVVETMNKETKLSKPLTDIGRGIKLTLCLLIPILKSYSETVGIRALEY